MSPPTDPASADEALEAVLETALDWQVRLHSGTAGTGERSAYAAWQLASPSHRAAAVRAEQLWCDLGDAANVPARVPDTRRWRRALAACLALGLLGGLAGYGQRDALFSDHHTGYGQRQTVALGDGSSLLLDADTAVDVDITAQHRRITLRRGQVHVTVAPDPARPFDVSANGGTIRALGTAFNVRRDDHHVDVAVTEHVVRVSHRYATQTAVLHEGEHLRYRDDGALGTPADADLRTVTAWQRGYLVFDGAPLAEVVAQLSHYRRGYVLIRDHALDQLTLTGVFKTGDTDALLDALPQTLPVRVRHLPGLVLIEAAQS